MLSLGILVLPLAALAGNESPGAVYTLSNAADANRVLAFSRDAHGELAPVDVSQRPVADDAQPHRSLVLRMYLLKRLEHRRQSVPRIEATKELAKSPGAKTIIIGNKDTGLPLILGADK